MRLVRSTLFWLHLAAGLLCGAIIAIMSFTGAVLAFEGEIVAWAERDVRRVSPPPAGAVRISLDDLVALARDQAMASSVENGPIPTLTGVTITTDPLDAVAFAYNREFPTRYINPYTGEVRVAATTRAHDFMHLMEDWHRRLALSGDRRDTGRAITGASNAAFLFLALSGLWLWWPRQWTARFLRPALSFVRGASGRARDWNWHNALGFWSLPILVVLTATGMVISYRWASDLPYRLVGETPPAFPGPGAAAAKKFNIERPQGSQKLPFSGILARIQAEHPAWTEITLREGLPRRRGAPSAQATPPATTTGDKPRAPRAAPPYSATVKADDGSPAFASTQLVLHPYTGDTLDRSGYADQTTGRKIRAWLRYLHTGQALGWPGQLLAGLACLAACVLVWTGFALSWRRFFKRAAG